MLRRLMMRLHDIKNRLVNGGISGIFMDDYRRDKEKREQIDARLELYQQTLDARARLLGIEARNIGRRQ